MNRMKKTLAAVVTMLMALPFVANAQTVTFEDDYFTYEKVTDSTVKIIGFSTKFSEKASTDVLHEDGKIYLTRWGAPFTEPVIDGTRLDITTIGELAFSPDNPLYDSWPEGKELCKSIVVLETTWSSLTKIEDKAFMNCENLSDISLGNMTYPHKPMSYIGKFAFAGTKLYNVYWTSDCKTIEDGCFANIPTLTGFSSSSSRSDRRSGSSNGVGTLLAIVIAIACTALAYFFTLLTRFAISRKREFMADAGGAELCGNPRALASALRKISGDPGLAHIERDDVAQLFIVHPQPHQQSLLSSFNSLFATHPDTAERIRILEQF